MTPRQRVFAALQGEVSDRTPFVIWDNKVPGPQVRDRLLAHDACIIIKSTACTTDWQDVTVRSAGADPSSGETVYETPAGTLVQSHRTLGSRWVTRHLFRGPADYEALEALIRSRRYTPCFERFAADDATYPGRSIARPATLRAPMHALINEYMGVEAFSIEWAERRDRVDRLCALLKAETLAQVHLLARSPARYVVVDGNTQFDICGTERYRRYYLPYINEACEILHDAGKLVGAHLDGHTRQAADLVAQTNLDFIESFTPPPDCDHPLPDARAAWPGKTLVLNFPSSVHLRGRAAVTQHARALLQHAATDPRIVMGVSEDVPTTDHLVLLAQLTGESAWTADKGRG